MHNRMGIAVVVVLALGASCKKNNGEKPATSDGSGSGSATMTASGSTGSGSVTGSGSASGAATSALPAGMAPLGDAPQGMDAAKAKACDTGDAAACTAAAESIAPTGAWRVDLSKEEGDRRAAAAITWGQRACDLKNGEGCYVAARYDSKNEDPLSKQGCDLGYQPSCAYLAWSLLVSGHSDDEITHGRELLEAACRANVKPFDLDADDAGKDCNRIAEEWSDNRGKLKKDKAKVAELKQLACDQGMKWDCKCKKDEDCTAGGKGSDDEEWYCVDGYCSQPSGD